MFGKKLVYILLLSYVSCVCLGLIFDQRYRERWSILFFDKTNLLINDSSYYDLVYIGNSRVHFGINPYYVDSVTGLKSFNLGIGGADAEEMMLAGNMFLQKHPPPRFAILALDRSAFGQNTNIRSRFHYLFYLQEDSVYQRVKRSFPVAPLLKVFPFVKYGLFDEYNRTSLFVKGTPIPVFDHNIYQGFVNIHESENKPVKALFNNRLQDSVVLSKQSEVYLKNVIANFLRAGTKVIIISSPERSHSPGNTVQLQRMRDSLVNVITKGLDIRQFHFRNSPVLTDKYFLDEKHLNAPGAKAYSLQLADSIKTIL